jgi:hypothetical protein
MNRTESALKYFDEGCDCGKALLRAYEPILPLDEATRAGYRASCSELLGRPAERCEVVSGAFEVLSHLGHSDRHVLEELSSRFNARFLAAHGSTSCKKLLGYDLTVLPDFSEAVDSDAVGRVCRGLIKEVCEILDELVG